MQEICYFSDFLKGNFHSIATEMIELPFSMKLLHTGINIIQSFQILLAFFCIKFLRPTFWVGCYEITLVREEI